ncbi:tRNA pseudouridine(55) synthase TruB [Candidatus Kuenenbacteria bacterium]|nr:tRNA pseudouridine(55) synthase TruB [Candidatus Kuenenbacteria bacterium]
MFLLINKPSGPTSHDIISQLRKITGQKRIGHAGTLDPFAEGLLICALGRESTKQLGNFLKLDKTYLATLKLGATSDTYDRTGNIIFSPPCQGGVRPAKGGRGYRRFTKKIISSTLQKFLGMQLQTPPIFSAKKISGQTAYKLARQGKTVTLKPNQVTIYDIRLKKLEIQNSKLEIEVRCSSGTYIRSLAHDLGQALGCGAYLEELKRLAIGPFSLAEAVSLDQLNMDNWQQFLQPLKPSLPAKTRVLVFGTFDCLHSGHLNFLRQAKKLGDELHVVIARDKNVKNIKQALPTNHELRRLQAVRETNLPTTAMLGQLDFDHRFRVLGKIRPDIIALGYDQKLAVDTLEAKIKHYHLATKIVRLKAYHPEIYKSSLLNKTRPLAKSPIV